MSDPLVPAVPVAEEGLATLIAAVHHCCEPSNLADAPPFAMWCHLERTWKSDAARTQLDYRCTKCGEKVAVTLRPPSLPSVEPEPLEPSADEWRIVRAGTVAPLQGGHGTWVETNHPAVVACMGSAPACQANGCQLNNPLRQVEPEPPTAQKDEALRLAERATNGWACYAKRDIEHEEIARLHEAIRRLRAVTPPSQLGAVIADMRAQAAALKEWAMSYEASAAEAEVATSQATLIDRWTRLLEALQ